MKLTNYLIAFFIISGIFMFIANVNVDNLVALGEKDIEYNNNVDTAIEDAARDLVEVDNNKELITNKQAALDAYFNSLYSNFGVLDNPTKQAMLQVYTPIFVVCDNDGFYINYCTEQAVNTGDNGTGTTQAEVRLIRKWTDKTTYSYGDSDYVYSFKLDDTLTILNKNNNTLFEGTRKDVIKSGKFPGSICENEKEYTRIRKNAIISTITKFMKYYINEHNNISKLAGITYEFSLPTFSDSQWTRTISDISLFAIFQGYPYGNTTNDVYNKAAFGAARITKKSAYYILSGKEDGVLYYHKYNCTHLDGVDLEGSTVTTEGNLEEDYGGNSIDGQNKASNSIDHYYTKYECAQAGAYACPDCKP